MTLVLAACGGSDNGAESDAPVPPVGGTNAVAKRGPCSITKLGSAGLVPGEVDPALTADELSAEPIDPEAIKEYTRLLAQGILALMKGKGEFVGWAFDELSGETPDAATVKGLEELSGKLDQISSQLVAIEAQLAAITNLIKDTAYISAIKSLTENHVAPILSMWQQYCEIVHSQDTDERTITKLSDEILNSTTGVRAHVTAITLTFKGSSLTGDVPLPGMFAEFAKHQGRFAEFDDQSIYEDTLDPYAQYFANIAVMGLTLMTEAWHERGDTKAAQATLNDLWDDIAAIFEAGGHPVSNDKVVTQTSTQTAWTRGPLCVTAGFSSAEAAANLANGDQAQKALAVGALAANATVAGQAVDGQGWADAAGVAPADRLGASVPLESPSPYTFAKGDSVCSMLWWAYAPEPRLYIPALTESAGLPSTWVSTGEDDSTSPWRSPTEKDYKALIAERDAASAKAYLNASGFTVPGKGVSSVGNLAYGFDAGGRSGFLDTEKSSTTCLFFGGCAGGQFLGFHVMADIPCQLGSGAYVGVGTACGTDWLEERWPASPPPPEA